MKNLNKLIRILQSYYCLGLYFGILQAQEVVITEFFINSAEGTQIPQYIELYNNTPAAIPLEGWSIITKDEIGVESSYFTEFSFDNDDWVTIHNSSLEIEPNGYFLISSNWINGDIFSNNHHSDIEVLFILSEAGSIYLYEPGNSVPEDQIEYDSDWPIKTGHSTILQLSDDTWSLSPEMENSDWLYEGSDPINFGSPGKENAFKLSNIRYSDDWFYNIEIDTDSTHIIYGDYIDSLKAEPFEDFGSDELPDTGDEGEGNGIWDLGEEYHDRNQNGIWDNQKNNYGYPLLFSWVGTFIDTNDSKYEIIIEKKILEKNGKLIDDSSWENISNTSWENIPDNVISILPLDLSIDPLGQGREIAKYSWTVELTKTFSNGSTDTIYSDKYTFTIDASDYGIYGCVDDGCCTNDQYEVDENDGCLRLCPTNAFYEELYISKHPTGCTPGVNCYSALNYHETAKINSKTCHYVSLSVPAFVVGDPDTVVTVPVYLYNDSSANINSITYTLSFDNSSEIISYYKDASIFAGTILSGLENDSIIYDGTNDISVNMALSAANISFNGAGIITYLAFELIGQPSDVIGLTFSSPIIIGGETGKNIQVPVKDGEIVILQPNYEIKGNVVYYSGDDTYEVQNVELTLNKMYDGVSADTSYIDTTNKFGLFNFKSLTEGHYSLSFNKEDEYDTLYCFNPEFYVSGTDVSDIVQHVTGYKPLDDPGQLIAADVSLDGTVSGLDASLVAQYIVGLGSNFNNVNTHWIFKPADTTTLAEIYADLIKDNGEYMIEYSPLVFDDYERDIYAYRLGDVNGNYCHDEDQSRYKNDNLQFKDIIVEYKPVISLPIILAESVYVQGIDIEIGYDKDIFEPLSITFNSLNQQSENYESLSNLFSNEGTIKTVTWAADGPQLINGIIGEVSFSWENNNEGGKIWLENFQVNDVSAGGGISLTSFNGEEIAKGVNIINKLYPEEITLQQNYPNPFNPQTTIYWSLPNSGNASIDVYNIQGQQISHLFDGYIEPGTHEQLWNASAYPSGIYFYRLTIGENVLQKKMILLR